MTGRACLPDRRSAVTRTVRWADQDFEVTVGRYPDGRPGEVFVTAGKTAEAVQQLAADAAVLLSVGLQHGLTPAQLGASLPRHADGRPYTVVGVLTDLLHDLYHSTLTEERPR